jgi:hypothetical protein
VKAHNLILLLLSEPCQANFTIIKHFYFKNKMKPVVFKQYCYGAAHKLTFTHPKIGVKVFQYTFENLSGNSFLCMELSPEAKGGKETTSNLSDKTDEEVEAGFEFIAKEAAPFPWCQVALMADEGPEERHAYSQLAHRPCAADRANDTD